MSLGAHYLEISPWRTLYKTVSISDGPMIDDLNCPPKHGADGLAKLKLNLHGQISNLIPNFEVKRRRLSATASP
ncbi:hypothetical protein EVAR_19807_1 [Eumeta japonica]|uniref:Uncharacterized protein n=1 Tax=Eumeta variegata TaxID=151549 RepID=A0A4C1UQQ0_EUMVA|nr:hypothetical protein EVAR_19807_1 [Eumeta japonica]